MSFVFEKPVPAYAKGGRWGRRHFVAAALIIISVFLSRFFFSAPNAFPTKTLLSVQNGATLSEVTDELSRREIIRSPFWFKALVTLSGGNVLSGDYAFTKPQNVFVVAERFSAGRFELAPVRVTIPEGSNHREISVLLKKVLPVFNSREFVLKADAEDGYLFPDTYFFLPNVKPDQVIATMRENFYRKTAALNLPVEQFGQNPRDVLIMASLLEEEARTTESRRIIAGILWKRLDKGMLLQVDAVFPYIFNGRPYDLTDGDLETDSPYNTYKYKGLPPGPITNPGLDAIIAAVTPIKTPYYFYLSDKNGEMHYAVTHDAHLVNRGKYLQ
jgi:UPF0755 protein